MQQTDYENMAEQILPSPVHNNVYTLLRNTGIALVINKYKKHKSTEMFRFSVFSMQQLLAYRYRGLQYCSQLKRS